MASSLQGVLTADRYRAARCRSSVALGQLVEIYLVLDHAGLIYLIVTQPLYDRILK